MQDRGFLRNRLAGRSSRTMASAGNQRDVGRLLALGAAQEQLRVFASHLGAIFDSSSIARSSIGPGPACGPARPSQPDLTQICARKTQRQTLTIGPPPAPKLFLRGPLLAVSRARRWTRPGPGRWPCVVANGVDAWLSVMAASGPVCPCPARFEPPGKRAVRAGAQRRDMIGLARRVKRGRGLR